MKSNIFSLAIFLNEENKMPKSMNLKRINLGESKVGWLPPMKGFLWINMKETPYDKKGLKKNKAWENLLSSLRNKNITKHAIFFFKGFIQE